MPKKQTNSDIAQFSRLVLFNAGLPKSYELAFYNKQSGRKVRTDSIIRRKYVNSRTFPLMPDDASVADFIVGARGLLAKEVVARDFEMRLLNGAGEFVTGQTHIKRLRIEGSVVGGRKRSAKALFKALVENSGAFGDSLTEGELDAMFGELEGVLGEAFETALRKQETTIVLKNKRLPGTD